MTTTCPFRDMTFLAPKRLNLWELPCVVSGHTLSFGIPFLLSQRDSQRYLRLLRSFTEMSHSYTVISTSGNLRLAVVHCHELRPVNTETIAYPVAVTVLQCHDRHLILSSGSILKPFRHSPGSRCHGAAMSLRHGESQSRKTEGQPQPNTIECDEFVISNDPERNWR